MLVDPTPPPRSPPTRFSSIASRSGGAATCRARINERNPGGSPSTRRSTRSANASRCRAQSAAAGTREYAQSVWPPAGARDGSHSDCWPMTRYGLSGNSPARACRVNRRRSATLSPAWTTADSRASAADHGTGPDSAQSTLNVPQP
ncbi:MAG: hypothetical protein U0797_20380 [Gemmataceae bacterium]